MNSLRGALAALFLAINTAAWCVPLYILGIVRFLLPIASVQKFLSGLMDLVIDGWVGGNRVMNAALRLNYIDLSFQTQGVLSLRNRYLLICNHQSWADIIILQNTFRGILPPLKFFTKRELIWIPLLGPAMWLLGFPYVKRGGAGDREAMAQSCAGFRNHPVTVLNFLEGTRCTAEKRSRTDSPYAHLLAPKTGGMAYVLGEIGNHIDCIIDVTISYPNDPPSFWQFLCGDCKVSRVHVEAHSVPVASDRAALDEEQAERLKQWTNERWQYKDVKIAELAQWHEHR